MYRVYIDNFGYPYHFEVVFSFLIYFNKKYKNQVKFYFRPNFISPERKEILKRFSFFEKQIRIKIPDRYDFKIVLTVYHKTDFHKIQSLKNKPNIFLVAHLYHPSFDTFRNLIYLTPIVQKLNSKAKYLLPIDFPYSKVSPNFNNPPVFLIQGNMQSKRRNYRSLIPILESNHTHKFKILILGRGNLPKYLEPYRQQIQIKSNLNDEEYHQAIQEATFILPLVDDTYQHEYFKKKLTSSITYGIGFGLRFVIFEKLARLYHLKNQYIYQNTNQLEQVFNQAVIDFYNKSLKPIPVAKNMSSPKLLNISSK